jgi:hypothetical protein
MQLGIIEILDFRHRLEFLNNTTFLEPDLFPSSGKESGGTIQLCSLQILISNVGPWSVFGNFKIKMYYPLACSTVAMQRSREGTYVTW